jgi:hypothetical protein
MPPLHESSVSGRNVPTGESVRSFEGQADPTTAGEDGDRATEAAVGIANLSRAGLAEMVGAFFLIYTGTATAVAATLGRNTGGQPPDSLAIALAFGFVLAALVGALGHISGAHLNPAVTLGLAVIGRFSWRAVPAYLGFQLLGAVLGALATWATFGGAARTSTNTRPTSEGQGRGAACSSPTRMPHRAIGDVRRPHRPRLQRPTRPPPLGRRTHHRLAAVLQTPRPAL